MAESDHSKNNDSSAHNDKSILEIILTRNEPVTADTEALYEKARSNPDAFADLLNARVNKHLGFNMPKAKT